MAAPRSGAAGADPNGPRQSRSKYHQGWFKRVLTQKFTAKPARRRLSSACLKKPRTDFTADAPRHHVTIGFLPDPEFQFLPLIGSYERAPGMDGGGTALPLLSAVALGQGAREPPERKRREIGNAGDQSYLGARLSFGFVELNVAGTPNFTTLPSGRLICPRRSGRHHLGMMAHFNRNHQRYVRTSFNAACPASLPPRSRRARPRGRRPA